jgi:hypothetical protein
MNRIYINIQFDTNMLQHLGIARYNPRFSGVFYPQVVQYTVYVIYTVDIELQRFDITGCEVVLRLLSFLGRI